MHDFIVSATTEDGEPVPRRMTLALRADRSNAGNAADATFTQRLYLTADKGSAAAGAGKQTELTRGRGYHRRHPHPYRHRLPWRGE